MPPGYRRKPKNLLYKALWKQIEAKLESNEISVCEDIQYPVRIDFVW